jgi:hypothetical protein
MVGHYNPLTQPTTGGGVMPPLPDVNDPNYKKLQRKKRRRLIWLLLLLAFGRQSFYYILSFPSLFIQLIS